MPIFVEWKWQENTETFLLILHFDDDGTQTNLRGRMMEFYKCRSLWSPKTQLCMPSESPPQCKEDNSLEEIAESHKRRRVVTWAPSHVEIGLLSQLLCYANILNGLKVATRRKLQPKLDLMYRGIKEVDAIRSGKFVDKATYERNIQTDFSNKISLESAMGEGGSFLEGCSYNFKDKRCESIFCSLLNPQYIDYIWGLIKPELNG